MKTKLLFLSRCLVGVTPLFVGASLRAAPLTWFPGAALNEPRSSAATVVTPSGSIMLFGGNPLGSTNVLIYGDSDVQPLNSTRIAPGAVALSSSQFFVYGGKQTSSSNSVTRSVLSYNPVSPGLDPESPNIFQVSPMNSRRYDLAYASDAAGYAYAIGGLGNNNTVLASVERYDSVFDTWTNMASLPVGTYHFGAVFDGTNTIYTFGGRTNVTAGTETAAVLSYNVSANTWSTLASMPVATAGSTAIKGPEGKFYVIGGTAGGVVTNLVQVYDPGNNTWLLSTPLPSAVTAASGAVDILGRLVVIGGADGSDVDLATSWVSQQLNIPDAAPAFISSPPLKANCLVPYTYAAHANGNPQPIYQLLTGPADMQIDPYSGVVSWTPQTNDFGTNLVTIQATNYSGIATQTFAIKTLGPPLAAPTNLVMSDVTDTSVTLSWDPTAFVIGPLTYQVYQRTFVHDPRGSGGGYVYGLIAGNLQTNSVTISALAVGSAHTYLVKALAAGVVSPYSAAITIVTTSPQPPQNLRLTGLTSTTTSLAWDPSPGPVPIGYYSLFDYGSGYTPIPVTGAAVLTNTYVTLTGLVPGSQHVYFVLAYDAAGHASSVLGVGATQLTVVNPVPTPAALSGLTPMGSGGIHFTVQQSALIETTLIQATTNLADSESWVTIATNPPTSSTYIFTDTDASRFPVRFYRVLSP